MNRKEIGMRIKLARVACGLSQSELASRVNVSDLTVSRIERGKAGIELDQLPKWAEALKQTLDYFLSPTQKLPQWELIPSLRNLPLQAQGISFGTGTPMTDDVRVPDADVPRENIFALRALGDCLAPEVNEGDSVIVDINKTPRKDGDLVVVQRDNEYLCKRYRKRNGQEWLEANGGVRIEVKDVLIRGTVIMVCHKKD